MKDNVVTQVSVVQVGQVCLLTLETSKCAYEFELNPDAVGDLVQGVNDLVS